jgi:hypothetical protein
MALLAHNNTTVYSPSRPMRGNQAILPELVSHSMRGQLVTPDHDGGLVLHGLLAHSGTGDEGYCLVA